MWLNYLKVILRNARKDKGHAFINIAGLAIGICCCVLILLFVTNELGYDRFHEHADQIFRVYRHVQTPTDETNSHYTPAPLAPVLAEVYPDIGNTTRISIPREYWVRSDERAIRAEVIHADPSIFDLFSFALQRGDSKTALADINTVVISQDIAQKLYSEDDPIGQAIEILDFGHFTVSGVLENIPGNSSLQFGVLLNMNQLGPEELGFWIKHAYQTYILLQTSRTPSELEGLFKDFIAQDIPGEAQKNRLNLRLQPLRDVYLNRHNIAGLGRGSSIVYSYILAGIALLVALVALVNFINLSVARSTVREKEIGIRKAFGANRASLVGQFLFESFFFSFLALVLGIVLAILCLPWFGQLAGKPLSFSVLSAGTITVVTPGLLLLFGLISGSYPALFLSRFRPAEMLRGRMVTGKPRTALRKGFVVFQFTLSVVLLIGSFVMQRQWSLLQTKNLGFDQDQVVSLSLPDEVSASFITSFKTELKSFSGIRGVAGASSPPGGLYVTGTNIAVEPPEHEPVQAKVIGVDTDYSQVLRLTLVEGRAFSEQRSTDAEEAVLVNETFAREAAWEQPLGQTIRTGFRAFPQGTVVGVVGDFHFKPLLHEIEPLVLTMNPHFELENLLVRITATQVEESLAHLATVWQRFVPDQPFDYHFIDQQYEAHYFFEKRWSRIILYATLLAVFLSCLGLLGMASFTISRRTKEIGIRKVLGATVFDVLAMLSKDFVRLVLLATALAWPVAYFAAKRWLQDYPYRIELGVDFFLLAGLIAVLMALFAIGFHALKAALANPVTSLRYE